MDVVLNFGREMSTDIKNQVSIALNLHQAGKFKEAESMYNSILGTDSTNTDALNLLGLLKIQMKQFGEAVFLIKKAVEIKPCAYFYENLGRAYFEGKNFVSAIECYKKSIEFNLNDFDVYFNLALAYKKNSQFDEAIETYNSALSLKPDSADVYFNMANAYENKNETQQALQYYEKAKELGVNDSNINYFLAVSYLKLKNFEQGWKYYEDRPSKPFGILTQRLQYKNSMDKPFWQGENIEDKTLFVYYEAAFGDSLMYARYLPLLSEKCKKVFFKPQNNLTKLFEDSDLKVEIIDKPVKNLEFDVHIPLMGVPYVLKMNSQEDIPLPEGYLRSNQEKVREYRANFFNNDKFKIGIKWQGNAAYDRNRIIPLETFYKLFNLPNTQFYSLQKGEGEDELSNLPDKYNVINLAPTFNDFADTAAAIENLDLVICNDTSVAHLAAGMGKKCWVLLPFVSNWRWHTDMSYSPWYNSVKLFKQTKLDDWNEVFEHVLEELVKINKKPLD